MFAEDAPDSGANQFASDGVGTFEFALIFEFKLAGDGGKRGINIGDARDGGFFASASGALLGAADKTFESGDREALADAGTAVDALVFARLKSNLFHHVSKIGRDFDLAYGIACDPGLLRSDRHAFFKRRRIVGPNFRADTVFERSDDFSASGVVFGIRGENDQDVQRQAQRVTLNLNVAFLHDVEQADLDFAGEVGEFV